MENGYTISMGLLVGAFAIIIFAVRGEIRKVFVSLKNGTLAKEH